MCDLLNTATPLPDAVVRYAEHPDGIVDLHLPEGPPHGAVLLLHGGFWRSAYDRKHTRPAASALRRNGYLVATPEYRRTGALGPRAGGWPATPTDVRDAAGALPGLLGALGMSLPRPLTVVGHSAGGHLALWLATEGLDVDRIVALAPVGDLREAYAEGLGSGAVAALMGGAPDEHPERYAAADPVARLTTSPGCRIIVVHGTEDEDVPLHNSDWARPLPHVDLCVVHGAGHMDLVDPASRAWPAVLRAVSGD